MAKQYCCPECFGDHYLRDQAFPFLEAIRGKCDYCATMDTALVEPSALAEWFGPLLSVYEQQDDGDTIIDWLKRDWQLFSHPKMDTAHAKELLADILDDGELVRGRFIPSPSYRSEALMQWETLRDEMMYQNRWFLDVSFDTDRLSQLLPYLLAKDLPTAWFRARIRTGDASYPIAEMGPPPSASPAMDGLTRRVFLISIWDRPRQLPLPKFDLIQEKLRVWRPSRFRQFERSTCGLPERLFHRLSSKIPARSGNCGQICRYWND
jgi:hypothetical protein